MSVSNFHLAKTISCHAWNGDKSKIALCPNNNEVHIYARNGNDWDLEHVLKEHDESQLITGLDWGAKTNRIVSCSQDRNAYVWKFENGIWKPTLVILRLQRAATSVKWSPLENKFAVSSGAKCVSVCYFEQDNDWWVSKHIKKHKSTVTRLDWHPNNVLLATSCTDYKARVFSAFIKGVDNKPGDTPFGSKLPFGEPLGEWLVGGWVHSIKWSPSGNALAFCSHDSALHVNDLSGGAPGNLQTIRLRELPLVDIVFLNENTIAGVGFDCQPLIFTNNGGTWAFSKKVDVKAAATAQKSGPASAMAVFKNKVETGQVENVTVLDTTHQNSITNLQNLGGNQFSTTGLDGRLVFWKA